MAISVPKLFELGHFSRNFPLRKLFMLMSEDFKIKRSGEFFLQTSGFESCISMSMSFYLFVCLYVES